jgi:hypothetical protein
MVDVAKFRSAFFAFLGKDRFRKFAPCGPELRYWEEQALEQFLAEHPEFVLADGELQKILCICPVHMQELQKGVADMFDGCMDYAQEYTDARHDIFPWAGMDLFSAEGGPFDGKQIEIKFCTGCRVARGKWLAEND